MNKYILFNAESSILFFLNRILEPFQMPSSSIEVAYKIDAEDGGWGRSGDTETNIFHSITVLHLCPSQHKHLSITISSHAKKASPNSL